MRAVQATAALASVVLLTTAAMADDKADQDRRKMQGKWVATSLLYGDKAAPADVIDKGEATLVVERGRFTFKTPDGTHEGVLQLDPSTSPKRTDFTCTSERDRVILCVYELDGDTLRVAANHDARPVDFKTRPGKAIVIALKRVKE
jgi:uncharacterized protein (TIGR03067 family)